MGRLSNPAPVTRVLRAFLWRNVRLPDTRSPFPSPPSPVHGTEAALRRKSSDKGVHVCVCVCGGGALCPGLGQGSAQPTQPDGSKHRPEALGTEGQGADYLISLSLSYSHLELGISSLAEKF